MYLTEIRVNLTGDAHEVAHVGMTWTPLDGSGPVAAGMKIFNWAGDKPEVFHLGTPQDMRKEAESVAHQLFDLIADNAG